MLTKKIIWLIIVLILSNKSVAQNFLLNGKVLSAKDSSNVTGAIIYLDGFNKTTSSDTLGKFTIDNINKSDIVITITKIGYNNFTSHIKLNEFSLNMFEFYLEEDKLNINNNCFTSGFKNESIINTLDNILTFPNNNNNYLYTKFSDFIDLIPQVSVIKNNSGKINVFKRGRINNFILIIDDLIIPKSYYPELLGFLPIGIDDRLEINNSPQPIMHGNSNGGVILSSSLYNKNEVNVGGYLTSDGYNIISGSVTNILKNLGHEIDTLKNRITFNYLPDYKMNNYYKYKNVNLLLTSKLYINNLLNNEINMLINKTNFNDYSPKLQNFLYDSYFNKSRLFTGSVKNEFLISKKTSIVLYNNYSFVKKEYEHTNIFNFGLSNISTKLFYNNSSLNLNYLIGVENNYEKVNYYNITNAFVSNNYSRIFGEVKYKLSYGYIYLGSSIKNYDKVLFTGISKIKINTSKNSAMIIGYSSDYNTPELKDLLAINYNYYGNTISSEKINLKPEKVTTLEAVFTYTDYDIYYLKFGFYSDNINDVWVNKDIAEGNNYFIKKNNRGKVTVNSAELEAKVIPFKNVICNIYLSNNRLQSDELLTGMFNPEKEISLSIEYKPFINTNIKATLRYYGNMNISTEAGYEINNIYTNAKILTLSSLTVLDLYITQKLQNFIFSLSIKNIFKEKETVFRNVDVTNVSLGLIYNIKY